MNYYSLILCFIVTLTVNETKQFVEFKNADITVVKENSHVTITLPFKVLADFHIQSNSDEADGSVATEITFKENNAYIIKNQKFSLKQDKILVLNVENHKVISNRFEVTVTLKLKENASNVQLEGVLYYQACSDRQCLFPRALNFQISL